MLHTLLQFVADCEHGHCCLLLSRDSKGWLEWPVEVGGGARAMAVEQPYTSDF